MERIRILHMLVQSDDPDDIRQCMDHLSEALQREPCMRDFPRLNDFWGLSTPDELQQMLDDISQYCDSHGISVE